MLGAWWLLVSGVWLLWRACDVGLEWLVVHDGDGDGDLVLGKYSERR
jgi:hypothetical protein